MSERAFLPLSEHTIGPFFPREYFGPADNDLTRLTAGAPSTAEGEPMLLRGRVTREDGGAVVNAILEAWQADARGRFRHPNDPHWKEADPGFLGWGRARTDEEGRYEFHTIVPRGYIDGATHRAPHINLSIWALGLMRRAQTTVFFPEFAADNARDPVFLAVPEDVRPRLVLRRDEATSAYGFDIRLRGTRDVETPFFED